MVLERKQRTVENGLIDGTGEISESLIVVPVGENPVKRGKFARRHSQVPKQKPIVSELSLLGSHEFEELSHLLFYILTR